MFRSNPHRSLIKLTHDDDDDDEDCYRDSNIEAMTGFYDKADDNSHPQHYTKSYTT